MKALLMAAAIFFALSIATQAQSLHAPPTVEEAIQQMRILARTMPILVAWSDIYHGTDSVLVVFATQYVGRTKLVLCPESAIDQANCSLIYDGVLDPLQLEIRVLKMNRKEDQWIGIFNRRFPKPYFIEIPAIPTAVPLGTKVSYQ